MSDPRHTDYLERTRIAFAMYCDEAGLTLEEGLTLAEDVADDLLATADDRESADDEDSDG